MLNYKTYLMNLKTDIKSRKLNKQMQFLHHLQSNPGYTDYLPREYEKFIGREGFKQTLREAIEGDPRIWIINLYGPGGVGKSALATWMAYEYFRANKPFEAILHLSAKDLELSTAEGIRHLRPTLVSLEDFLDRVLHLFEHSEYCKEDLDCRKQLVTEILSAYRTLLILDNMETMTDGRIMEYVRSLPPESKTKVLLTSRRRTSESGISNSSYRIQ